MPIREFRCKECGKVFEFLLLKESDKKEAACPECGSANLERLISLFGISGSAEKSRDSAGCSACSGGTCSTCN